MSTSAIYAGQHRGGSDAYASYFAGMDASMRQKVALTTAHFPTRGTVADMGSGSGRGTFDLACLHPELELVGVDINPVAVETSAATYRRANLRYVTGDIAAPVFPPGSLDAILDSSVLHHVTSFTGYSHATLERGLDHQVAALRPGGVLVIRDFVIPDGPAQVLLDVHDDDGADDGPVAGLSTYALWCRYARTVRNSRWDGNLAWTGHPVPQPGWRRIACNLRDAQEFILRKDYRADWEVELQEEYTYWDLAGFTAALGRRGLRVVTAAPIWNPWIIANRYRDRVRLWSPEGSPLPLPPTNAVIVGEQVGPGRGTRLVPVGDLPAERPAFLHLHGWRGPDGRVLDLAERPGRTVDVLPWCVRDGQVLVAARHGVERPLVVADPGRPNLTGAHWSGWLTEPVAAIAADDEPVGAAARRIAIERAGLPAGSIRSVDGAIRYAPSPGGLDEVVTSVLVEVDPDAATGAQARWLDAGAVLRAAQIGGLFDARLELNVHRLLRRLGRDAGPWIGEAVALPPAQPGVDPDPAAIAPDADVVFAPAEATGWLDIRMVAVDELAADGAVVATHRREMLRPHEASTNTLTALPLMATNAGIFAGVERRHLPAIQRHLGASGLACVPAWRLPPAAVSPLAVPGFLAAALRREFAVGVLASWELGGAYLATPGATPELVHPRAVAVDGPGRGLRWLRLADLAIAAAEGRIADAHLAICALRAAAATA